jgi:hypothetical protein
MSQENYRRGSLRYSRHTCDACGLVEKAKGIMLPTGWLDLGAFGIEGMAICPKCRAGLSEAVAGWVLRRRKGYPSAMASASEPSVTEEPEVPEPEAQPQA